MLFDFCFLSFVRNQILGREVLNLGFELKRNLVTGDVEWKSHNIDGGHAALPEFV